MTYIPRRDVTDVIPNKFEAIRVLALECRRLNDELRQREESTDHKITSLAVDRLREGSIQYYDARERREQERSEAMLSAAEDLLAVTEIDEPLLVDEELGAEEGAEDAVETAAAADEATEPAAPAAEAEDDTKKAGDEEE